MGALIMTVTATYITVMILIALLFFVIFFRGRYK